MVRIKPGMIMVDFHIYFFILISVVLIFPTNIKSSEHQVSSWVWGSGVRLLRLNPDSILTNGVTLSNVYVPQFP